MGLVFGETVLGHFKVVWYSCCKADMGRSPS